MLFHGVLADNHIEGVFTRKLNGGINTLSDTGVSSFNLGYGFAFSMNSADDAAFIGLQHSCASRRPGVERVQLQRNEVLSTIARLLFMLLRLAGVRLDETRIPDGAAKEKILTAIARARTTLQFAVVLRVLGLSPSRYHAWNRLERACQLDDRSSCPRTTPTQLTAEEVRTMHDLATSGCYRHMSVRGLALHAQRIGMLFASPATWGRLIRERGLAAAARSCLSSSAGGTSSISPPHPPYLVDYDGTNHPQSFEREQAGKDNNKKWDSYVDPKTSVEFFASFLRVALAHALTPNPAIYQWHASRRQALVE